VELNEYQRLANLTDQRPADGEANPEAALVFPLMGLASEVGSLVTQYKKRIRDGDAHPLFTDRVAEELGDVLWYVANLGAKLGLDLEDVAALNLKRITERWPTRGASLPANLLDDAYPAEEQLPRRASVRFEEITVDGRMKLRLTSEGTKLGDDLTDMNYDDDGYRFHDAFHLTYAAMLGWSPISRSLFKTKRESDSRVREIEDGGRAAVIEEAISALVFDYARKQRFLEGIPHLDFELLRSVSGFVSHLEVRTRTVHDWEQAILRSYEIWRELRDHRGGIVHLSLSERSIRFEPPPA
jgi:NTP pyrophosphatase (non-canonical NTP hydrolase)